MEPRTARGNEVHVEARMTREPASNRRMRGVKDFADRVKPQLPSQADEIDQITSIFTKLGHGREPNSVDLKTAG